MNFWAIQISEQLVILLTSFKLVQSLSSAQELLPHPRGGNGRAWRPDLQIPENFPPSFRLSEVSSLRAWNARTRDLVELWTIYYSTWKWFGGTTENGSAKEIRPLASINPGGSYPLRHASTRGKLGNSGNFNSKSEAPIVEDTRWQRGEKAQGIRTRRTSLFTTWHKDMCKKNLQRSRTNLQISIFRISEKSIFRWIYYYICGTTKSNQHFGHLAWNLCRTSVSCIFNHVFSFHRNILTQSSHNNSTLLDILWKNLNVRTIFSENH